MSMVFERGTTQRASATAYAWLRENLANFHACILVGLPEYDDRFDAWRIPLHHQSSKSALIGEIKMDNQAETIIGFTEIKLMLQRIKKHQNSKPHSKSKTAKKKFYPVPIPNKLVLGNSINVLEDYPPDSAQLAFTSPPYFNAKPEYSEYVDYKEYLDFMRRVILRCHAILSEGRFFVMNVSPVLIRRTSRNTSSKRIAIPFDMHAIFEDVGFEFVDDIIWVKPEGAGWNLGRGRRFKADRNPLQYKPVPVTEHVLVYRKKTDKLIDWNIRNHYDQELVEASKINGDYEVTDIWKIHPAYSKVHPAIFPEELASKVIQYYSFKDDLVLDPFGGIGTTGKAALALDRRFLLVDNEPEYFNHAKEYFEANHQDVRIDFDIHDSFDLSE